MNAPADLDWTSANQRLLVAEFARLRALLGEGDLAHAQAQAHAMRQAMPEPAAIDVLGRWLDLSSFERDVLLLAAGVEMDARLAQLCAQVSEQPARPWASFSLALACLPDPHWSALAPPEPLRRWRLLEFDDSMGLTAARLRLDERILHYLGGLNNLDQRLQPLLEPVAEPGLMCRDHLGIVEDVLACMSQCTDRLPTIVLTGSDACGQLDVAATLARRLGLTLMRLNARDIPASAQESALLATLWQREAALLRGALLISQHEVHGDPTRQLASRLDGLVILCAQAPLAIEGEHFTVDCPDAAEQRRLWQHALGDRAADSTRLAETLAGRYRLGARRIASIAAQMPEIPDTAQLHRLCRTHTPNRMGELAQPIDARADWGDLIVPEAQRFTLQQISVHARHRLKVHHDWGFAEKGARGLGIATLFWGDSGTGKTLAAEVLAHELDLMLYRIDLSAVVSKYIGETEKNLRKVFDDAEEQGAILLFDEADALFGKRSEVKDSHDRYANIEVSYLLQRMETYRGLAILTTNHKAALDAAFARRLRFVVHFPFPDQAQREALWRGVFPAATPLASLDYPRLAHLAVPGGTIRNIALSAAFLAAQADTAVNMAHLLRAAHIEAAKRDKPISDSEIRGWR
jgi:hypothetical protein